MKVAVALPACCEVTKNYVTGFGGFSGGFGACVFVVCFLLTCLAGETRHPIVWNRFYSPFVLGEVRIFFWGTILGTQFWTDLKGQLWAYWFRANTDFIISFDIKVHSIEWFRESKIIFTFVIDSPNHQTASIIHGLHS